MSKVQRLHTKSFPTTRWTHIRTLQEMGLEERRSALTDFVKRYQPALEAYIYSAFQALSRERAEDLAQGFTVDKLITEDLITKVVSERGRMRDFLKVAARNYCLSELRRKQLTPMSDLGQEEAMQPEWAVSAEQALDQSWAYLLTEEALSRTKERMLKRNQELAWSVFERRVINPAKGISDEEDYEILEADLGHPRRVLRNRLAKAKKVYARILRQVVEEYTKNDMRIDDELKGLLKLVQSK